MSYNRSYYNNTFILYNQGDVDNYLEDYKKMSIKSQRGLHNLPINIGKIVIFVCNAL